MLPIKFWNWDLNLDEIKTISKKVNVAINQNMLIGYLTIMELIMIWFQGAIVGGKDDTAAAKKSILKECGVHVADSPADIGKFVKKYIN